MQVMSWRYRLKLALLYTHVATVNLSHSGSLGPELKEEQTGYSRLIKST